MLGAGVAIGTVKHLGEDDHKQLLVELMSGEAVTTSAIEGEVLNRASVQSSILRQLGLASPDKRRIMPAEQGIVEMMVDLYRSFSRPLSDEMLFGWHRMVTAAEFFVAAREKFNVSRAVWANMLRVSPRTVEKWEQGGQVSPLAATFVELVTQYPDTIERLRTLPRRVPRTSRRMQRTRGRRNPVPRSNKRNEESGSPECSLSKN